MPTQLTSAKEFVADRAWGSLPIERFTGEATVKLHWTDQPYRWHVNDGPEVFVVLDGEVEMRARKDGVETRVLLKAGDVLHVGEGEAHVAHPVGVARVLVIETDGSQ
ncbi:cupin [Brevundimonas sp.]|uniref:cupin n=1 Tax=Brevundimonas sp. TaxID=1871086 RepID=UPI003D6CAA54